MRTAYDLGNAEVYVRPDVAGDIGIALDGRSGRSFGRRRRASRKVCPHLARDPGRGRRRSGAEWTAAIAFRNSFETAFGSLTRSKLADIGNGRAPLRRAASPAPGERQLAAVAWLKQVAEEFGGVAYGLGGAETCVRGRGRTASTLAYGLLELAIVEDLSWAAIGRRLQIDAKTARSWVVTAVKALAAVR